MENMSQVDRKALINKLSLRAEYACESSTQAFNRRDVRRYEFLDGQAHALRELIIELLDEEIDLRK